MLIGREFQASLDLSALQELIVTAPHDKRQSGQVGKDGSRAILSVEAQQHTFFRVVMGLAVALNGRHCPTQFGSVFPIAGVSKRAEKLMRMSLQDGGTGTHDFPTFAPAVCPRLQRAQTSLGSRPIRRFWQGTLAGRLPRPIHIEDKVMVPLPVEHPAWLFFFF